MPAWIAELRGVTAATLRDLKLLASFGPRTVDALETAVAVLLAVACAHALGEQHVGWAAYSACMVMRPHVAVSARRGLLRIIGTVAGAALACVLPAEVASSPALTALALAIGGAGILYFALTERHSYAWLFMSLTFTMIVGDGMAGATANLFAVSRIAEVVTGTACCLAVSAVSTTFVRRRLGGAFHAPPPVYGDPQPRCWHPAAARHAAKGALALLLVPFAQRWLHFPAPVQTGITILAVLMIPLANLEAAHGHLARRLAHRVIGCIIGGVVAAIGLHALHRSAPAMALLIALGVIVGRHIESGRTGAAYIGTQFLLAFLVVLVPDSYEVVDVGAGVERFDGVICGIVLLYPVLLLTSLPGRNRLGKDA